MACLPSTCLVAILLQQGSCVSIALHRHLVRLPVDGRPQLARQVKDALQLGQQQAHGLQLLHLLLPLLQLAVDRVAGGHHALCKGQREQQMGSASEKALVSAESAPAGPRRQLAGKQCHSSRQSNL